MKNAPHGFIQFIALSALALIVSCAPKPKQAKTKINIMPSMTISGVSIDGGALVYGQKTDGPGSWAKVFRPGQDVVVDMGYGTWNFSVFAFNGAAGELTGTVECSYLNGVDIAKESEVVDMEIDNSQCPAAGLRRLDLKLCTAVDFNSADPVTNCSETLTGIRSWRMRVLGHRGGSPNGEFLEGPCIVESDYLGPSLNRRFPSGLGNISKMPVEFVSYTSTDCSSEGLIIPFDRNLSSPSLPSVKTFQNINVLTMVANLQGEGIDVTAPVVTFDAPADAHVDGLRHWINDTNKTAFTLSGTCSEIGEDVNFTFRNLYLGIGITPLVTKPSSVVCSGGGTFTADVDFSSNTTFPQTTRLSSGYVITASQTDQVPLTGRDSITLHKDIDADTPWGITSWSTTPAISAPFTATRDNTPQVVFDVPLPAAGISGQSASSRELLLHPGADCLGGATSYTVSGNPHTFTTLADGTYSLQMRITDNAGNVSTSGCFGTNLVVDTIFVDAPVVNPTNGLGGSTVGNTLPTLTWTPSTAGDVVRQVVEVYENNSCTTKRTGLDTTFNDNTTTSVTLPGGIPQGTSSARVVSYDKAGNELESSCANNYLYDSNPPPAVGGVAFTAAPRSNNAQVEVTFSNVSDLSGIADYQVEFFSDAGCATSVEVVSVLSGGPYTATTTGLSGTGSDGAYYVEITANDNAGNNSPTTCIGGYERDTTPPLAATGIGWLLSGPTTTKTLGTNTWGIQNIPDTASLEINLYPNTTCTAPSSDTQTPAVADGDTFFNITAAGEYTFEVVTVDDVGNRNPTCSAALTVEQPNFGLGGEYVDGVLASATHLYALTKRGLEVYDINTNPNRPIFLEGIRVPFVAKQIALNGNFAVIMGDTEYAVISTSGSDTIANPSMLGVHNLGIVNPKDLAMTIDNKVWVVSDDSVRGIDISVPTAPSEALATTALGVTNCTSIEFVPPRDHLYVSCSTNLKPIDNALSSIRPTHNVGTVMDELVFNPDTAELIALQSSGSVINLAFASDDVADVNNTPLTGLGIIKGAGEFFTGGRFTYCTSNTVESRTPVPALSFDRTLNTPPGFQCQKALSNGASIIGLGKGILMIENSGATTQDDIDPVMAFSGTWEFHVDGNRGLVANGGRNVDIIDMTDPENPKSIGTIQSAFDIHSVYLNTTGQRATLLGNVNMQEWNITDPAAPTSVQLWGSFTSGSNIERKKIVFDTAPALYYVNNNSGAGTAILKNGQSTPVFTLNTCVGGTTMDIELHTNGTHLLVACSGGANKMEVWDVTNPEVSQPGSPFGTETFGGAAAEAVTSNDTHAFVVTNDGNINPVSLSNLTSPTWLNAWRIMTGPTNPRMVKTVGPDKLFVAAQNGVYQYIVGGLSSVPPLLSSFAVSDISRSPKSVSIMPDQYVFTANNQGGIEVIKMENPEYMHQ